MENINKKPVFLNLFIIRLPVAGVLSILHRVSGVILVLAIPWLLFILHTSLDSELSFAQLRHSVDALPVKAIGFVLIWLLCHHFLAGIRFLFMDLDWGLNKQSARISAWAVNISALLISMGFGYIWLV